MDDKLVLKNRLKEARTEKGFSQQQVAEMVGVSRNTISSIETGQFNPTAKLALVLCIALDKKFEELFYFYVCLAEFIFQVSEIFRSKSADANSLTLDNDLTLIIKEEYSFDCVIVSCTIQ